MTSQKMVGNLLDKYFTANIVKTTLSCANCWKYKWPMKFVYRLLYLISCIFSGISVPFVYKVYVEQSLWVELNCRVPVAKHPWLFCLPCSRKILQYDNSPSQQAVWRNVSLPCLNKLTHYARLLPILFKKKLTSVIVGFADDVAQPYSPIEGSDWYISSSYSKSTEALSYFFHESSTHLPENIFCWEQLVDWKPSGRKRTLLSC